MATADEDDYKYSIDMKSDAAQLAELQAITKLYLDKVGDKRITETEISDGETFLIGMVLAAVAGLSLIHI